MYELPALIPDAQTLLSLEPEELAGKILFALRKRLGNRNGGDHPAAFSRIHRAKATSPGREHVGCHPRRHSDAYGRSALL
jgi:hypothetical protein